MVREGHRCNGVLQSNDFVGPGRIRPGIGMVAAVLLPALHAANAHLGWPAWVVLLATGVGTIVGALIIAFAFFALSELRDRFDIWWKH